MMKTVRSPLGALLEERCGSGDSDASQEEDEDVVGAASLSNVALLDEISDLQKRFENLVGKVKCALGEVEGSGLWQGKLGV
jgi:hypothetical protein